MFLQNVANFPLKIKKLNHILSHILSDTQSAEFHEFLYNVMLTNFAQLYDATMNCALSMVISIKLYVERWNVGHVFRNIRVTWRKRIRDVQ